MTEWIRVDDKRPSLGDIVITYGYGAADTEYCQARYDGGTAWQELDICGDYFAHEPSHWMPLPQPPKG